VLNEVVERMPVYLLNSVNPYRVEGQKTVAFELLEQRAWEPPDHIVVPGGNLANSSAIGKALREMKQLGFISRVPRVSVIQAEGANPLVRSVRENGGEKLIPVHAETMATAIRIGNPASWKKSLRVIRETDGTVEQVSEIEIAQAKAEIGAEGIGCEPASAVTLAGLKKLVKQGFVKPNETVVLVLTGHTLKDADFTLKFHRGDLFEGTAHEAESKSLQPLQRSPLVLEPRVDAVIELLQSAE
jgi:threonine synthase